MNEGKCCGTCRYHQFDEDQDDWECENEAADAYLSWTGYDDCCEDYEPRERTFRKSGREM